MIDDEDKLFPKNFSKGIMGQLVTGDKLCVTCMPEMI
jgi:hypothetical protein